MVTLALTLVLAQTPAVRVSVMDVSDSDAIYEDISRGLAEDLAKALTAAGFDARRVDESEMPEAGCQVGPCLEKVVRSQKAQVLVTMDAKEVDKTKISVGLTALLGSNGAPLAGARYTLKAKQKKPPKEIAKFATELLSRARRELHLDRPDAGK